MSNTKTIKQRVSDIRNRFNLGRTQLFVEGRELVVQGLPKDAAGTYGCEWQAQRGESLHDALDEAEDYLANRVVPGDK